MSCSTLMGNSFDVLASLSLRKYKLPALPPPSPCRLQRDSVPSAPASPAPLTVHKLVSVAPALERLSAEILPFLHQ